LYPSNPSLVLTKLNSNRKVHTRLTTEQKESSVLRNNAMQYFTLNIKKGSKG